MCRHPRKVKEKEKNRESTRIRLQAGTKGIRLLNRINLA
jgi:hypothetical protein